MNDVVIVGGGHVGLYLASRLAAKGFSVSLLDQKKAIGESIVCTGIIGREAFEKFDLPRHTIRGNISQVRFFSPANTFFDYTPPQILADIVDRAEFNRFLADKARSCGARIFTDTHVQGIRQRSEGFSIRAADQSVYNCKTLVLATGVNYKLFKWVGIEAPTSFLSGAQIHIPYRGESFTSIYVGREVAPGSFAWLVPLDSGTARVGLLSEQTPALYLKRLLDRIRPGWRDDFSEKAIDLRPVVQDPLERTFTDRVLVVGEAAGQIKTTTGGGIYYGLLGAEIAAETLEQAFRKNKFSANLLSSYDRRWKKEIGEELRFGQYCRKLFAKLTDEQIEEFFDRFAQEEILDLAQREALFDWHRNLLVAVLKLPKVKKLFHNPF